MSDDPLRCYWCGLRFLRGDVAYLQTARVLTTYETRYEAI